MKRRHPSQRNDSLFTNADAQANNPTASWWCGVDRADFGRAVAAQAPRMRRSKFGNVDSPTYGDNE